VSKVLGNVLNADLDEPRGPDVVHRIHVPQSWLDRGATIEFELPRNLTCAECDGGGCDACSRAGAITLRAREDPVEVVQVTLPTPESESAPRDVILRSPQKGGLPKTDPELPRGLMMLRVSTADSADDKVWLSDGATSLSEAHKRAPSEVILRSVGVAVLLVLLFVAILKISGWL
jgi:hypothetical protein